MEYDNTNTGALFKNNQKQTPQHPDYRGEIDVEGTKYWVSSWIKKSKKGETFMSLSLRPVVDSQRNSSRNDEPYPDNSLDDEIPF